MAENQFLMTMLEAGSTNVSNLLLHHYHDIDMTTGELMVYLELKSYIDRGTRPRPRAGCRSPGDQFQAGV